MINVICFQLFVIILRPHDPEVILMQYITGRFNVCAGHHLKVNSIYRLIVFFQL